MRLVIEAHRRVVVAKSEKKEKKEKENAFFGLLWVWYYNVHIDCSVG
jgi:hypothetical protein